MRQPHRIVVGLGFGDEAKGATVDHLCAGGGVAAVVRFSGGAQAAHNVVVGGAHHTFRQFGSGTLAGVASYLSRHVLVSPEALAAEAVELEALGVRDPLGLVTVSPDALVVTPVHRAANRTREDLRGGARHGSCGLGIGETRWYDLAASAGLREGEVLEEISAPADVSAAAIRVRDCLDPAVLREKLVALADFYEPLLALGVHEAPSVRQMAVTLLEFGRAVAIEPDSLFLRSAAERGSLVFEGSQGVLLDEWRGFHPHTTWSTVTPAPAQALLASAGLERGEVWGATRAYATRHGAGPFPTEDASLAGVLPEPHNAYGDYQGDWRVGHLDLTLLEYAARVCRAAGGLDRVAVSHLDVVEAAGGAAGVSRYGSLELDPLEDLGHQRALTAQLLDSRPVIEAIDGDVASVISGALGVPLGSVSYGAGRADRRWARADRSAA